MRKVAKVEKITMVEGVKPRDIRQLEKTEFPAYTNCTPIKPPTMAKSSTISFLMYPTIFLLQPKTIKTLRSDQSLSLFLKSLLFFLLLKIRKSFSFSPCIRLQQSFFLQNKQKGSIGDEPRSPNTKIKSEKRGETSSNCCLQLLLGLMFFFFFLPPSFCINRFQYKAILS